MENKLPLEKLPKWAQEHIKTITMQREAAVSALNDFTDSQTESPVYYELHPCDGCQQGPSFRKHYIQTNAVHFNYGGVDLRVSVWNNEITLSWGGKDGIRDAAMIPFGYNQVRLVTKEMLR